MVGTIDNIVKPYKAEIVFLDTEFTGLYHDGVDLLSIWMVKPTGEQFYADVSDYNRARVDPWVQENIIPLLRGPSMTKAKIRPAVRDFVGKGKPYAVIDVCPHDWMGMLALFNEEKLVGAANENNMPFSYIPVDFSTVLFSAGIDPDASRMGLAESLGIDVSKYRKHNALDDALVVKALYEKITR